MRFRFTNHAVNKFLIIKRSGFKITRTKVKNTVKLPLKVETKSDGTFIATSLIDASHVFRVVYRVEGAIIVIITFYPGRRKAYEI